MNNTDIGKTHKRWIKCSQVITYNQEVELTDEELEILENADELDISPISSDDGKAFELIESLLDLSDVSDSEQEFTSFELTEA